MTHRLVQFGIVLPLVYLVGVWLAICRSAVWLLSLSLAPLHFSFPRASIISLFRQSSHLSCGFPRFLQPACFFVSELVDTHSSFILTMGPSHIIRLLTSSSTTQAFISTFYLLKSFIILLSTLFTPAIPLIQLFLHACNLHHCS